MVEVRRPRVRSQNPGWREKRGEKSEQRTQDRHTLLGRWGVPKVWKSELQKLQNEVLRRPKALPEASWRSEAPIGTLWGRSLGALGSLLGAPGSLWCEVLGALGDPGDGFWMIFWVRGACQCKNTKNLELDDPLHGFATF